MPREGHDSEHKTLTFIKKYSANWTQRAQNNVERQVGVNTLINHFF
jgi:hypothetical protein